MARAEAKGPGSRKACCLVSEVLEEAGLDRLKARQIRRQVLEGIVLLCRWQLERMGDAPGPSSGTGRKARRVKLD
jgi:hypothetical protein